MTKLVETEIPDWAEWMAQDKDGTWCVFQRMPSPRDRQSMWEGGGVNRVVGHSGKNNPNWRQTLHKLEEK